jgi:hypothetical protein
MPKHRRGFNPYRATADGRLALASERVKVARVSLVQVRRDNPPQRGADRHRAIPPLFSVPRRFPP